MAVPSLVTGDDGDNGDLVIEFGMWSEVYSHRENVPLEQSNLSQPRAKFVVYSFFF